MKKRKNIKKEIPKIKLKKTKNLIVSKHINRKEPDLWKEISSKFQPLIKTYSDYRKKRKIAKIKEEQRRIKMEEKQRLKEEETQILIEQEERKLKKEKRLKAKKIKEDQEEREKQALIYKERLAKGEKERLFQLEEVRRLKEEEKKLIDVRNLMRERRLKKEQKLEEGETQRFRKDEEPRLKEEKEQRLKEEEEQRLKEEERRFDEQKKIRLNGKVKWYSGAKGYGFIEREGEEKDIFVHFSAVGDAGLKYLKEGEQLTFEVENTDKGSSAINLQKTS